MADPLTFSVEVAKRRNLAVLLVTAGAVVAATAIFLWNRTANEADRLKFALSIF